MSGDCRERVFPRRCPYPRCLALLFMLAIVLFMGPVLAQAPWVPPNGFWQVQGRAVSGTRCGDWFVRLAVEQGRLTGVVGVGQGNIILRNVVLRPDGSFSGDTPAGHVNHRVVRAYQVTGRFTGDIVTVAMKSELCPDRGGSARRQNYAY
jgi:hypothetical protein